MKPAPFVHHAPRSLDEALAVLADVGADGKVLAGGQSLVPLLSMRLASPAHVIDVNALRELAYVRVDTDVVRVGALARHADVERDPAAAQAQPLLRQALRHVAHPVIRNRGTTVGSIVHADPAGEMPGVLSVLGGSVEVASTRGRRVVAAADLFAGPLETTLRADELAVEARFPVAGPQTRTAFVELARRHGDYAMCGVALVVETDPERPDHLVEARAGYLSMAGTPVVLDLLEAARAGEAAVVDLVERSLEPDGDLHASADYRRHLAGRLTLRALAEATATRPSDAVA